MKNLLIPIASDHRGFHLKSQFITWLKDHECIPQDLGPDSDTRCDAFDYATKMAAAFKSNAVQFGVLICGTGQAMAMTANRFQNIRAALCTSVDMARLAREHNDANVLALGADITSPEVALQCLETFLTTPFLGGRYTERRDRLTQLGGL